MVDEEAGVYLVLLPSAPPMAITVGSVSNCQDLWIKLFERQLSTTEIGNYDVSFGAHEAGRGASAR